MVTTVTLVDAAWYTLIALIISHRAFLDRLRSRGETIDRILGIVLIALALTVLIRAF